jgi:hypothetical protein
MGCPRPALLAHACCRRCRATYARLAPICTARGRPGKETNRPGVVGTMGTREQAAEAGEHGERAALYQPLPFASGSDVLAVNLDQDVSRWLRDDHEASA